MRLLLRSLAFVSLAALAPAFAHASCTEYRDIGRDEARQLMSAMVAPEADPLEQLFAFEDLMCANLPALRRLALKTGASSGNETVLSQILYRALAEKRILRIELGEGRPIQAKNAKLIKPIPVIEFDVLYRDPAAGCLSFHQASNLKGCHVRSVAQIFGTTMTMKIDWSALRLTGEFIYDHGSTLTGEIHMNHGIYPATINLF